MVSLWPERAGRWAREAGVMRERESPCGIIRLADGAFGALRGLTRLPEGENVAVQPLAVPIERTKGALVEPAYAHHGELPGAGVLEDLHLASAAPTTEIIVPCAQRRQVLRQKGSPAADAEDIRQAADDRPRHRRPFVGASPGGRGKPQGQLYAAGGGASDHA